MLRLLFALILFALPATAQEDVADLSPLPGWEVHATDHDFNTLVQRTRDAIGAHGLAVVTQAGPTGAAARRGIEIPGNRVIGAFNNHFAVRLLRQSTEAMIHAPIRFYVTENADGTATLSYIAPSTLLSPYETAADVASELDDVFAAIAQDAVAR
ncbi:DUF302 domain-containing protein [Gymnodinialimonas hymeniacidonis]|uniref:DUF302 domain-containing protein n=1 Tax=Gymnodinialimonas hymeniacidonis TaxID=3126508 RepID=UPI0034C61754